MSTRCQSEITKNTGRQETISTIPFLYAALSLDKSSACEPTSAGHCSLVHFFFTLTLSLSHSGLLFLLTTPFPLGRLAEAPHNMPLKTWHCRFLIYLLLSSFTVTRSANSAGTLNEEFCEWPNVQSLFLFGRQGEESTGRVALTA